MLKLQLQKNINKQTVILLILFVLYVLVCLRIPIIHIYLFQHSNYTDTILCTDFLIPCFHVIITLLSLTLPSLYPLSLIISTPGLTVSKSSGSINLSFSIFDEDEEFYVRIQSEDGQKICDGIFSQHELENINCPYEK